MRDPDGHPCLVCAAPAREIARLPATRTRLALAAALGDTGRDVPPVPDYRLMECTGCGLAFADPMREPGESFYAWLVAAGLEYPASRWEWTACLDDLRARAARVGGIAMLDVGCGSGGFLEVAARVPGVRAEGIDLNSDVVESCRARGLRAWRGTLSDWRREHPGRFNAICLWHVVEHVADPVGTLEEARALLAPGGTIYFSVPLSPMSYEGAWPDPFNLPPHHLTRWILGSLEALGGRLGMATDFLLPAPGSRWQRTLRALVLVAANRASGAAALAKGLRLVAYLLRHPGALLREWLRQGRRARDREGRILPDVVLVRLSKPVE